MDGPKEAKNIRREVSEINRFIKKIRLSKPDVVEAKYRATKAIGRLSKLAGRLENGV